MNWTACHTAPGFERKVQAEIERLDIGTFVPTFARTWLYGGKVRAEEHPIFSGYVLIATTPERAEWLGSVEGVQRTLDGRVTEQEMARLTLQHVMGDLNEVRVRAANGRFTGAAPRSRSTSRKPRPMNAPSKRSERRKRERERKLARMMLKAG